MRKFISYLLQNFKEYLLLIILLVTSLTLLSQNDKKGIEKIRTFAFGNFAFVTASLNSLANIFVDNDELNQLRIQNAELMLEVNRLRNYALENHELRNLMNYKDTSSFPFVPAEVISKLISNTQHNFIINVGNKDSVYKGMGVINEKGLIGLISEAHSNFSMVRTIKNARLKIAVTNQRSGVSGIMTWDGTHLIIKNIPSNYDFQMGDRIVTSDFSTIMPPMVSVGIVTKKEITVSGQLSNIQVEPFVDLNKISDLFVLKIIPSKQIDSLQLNLMAQ
ncbi:MAG: rod shape-determining protein MreC [Melioribacteraceae bacterium]|nr:rod shape-determining protein MreC [Melioribacteraceae bacterium]MCF8355537.1 rod shape-determining protein MreC [Melioribacteraceae bacterium]MCF8394508.1 rod shape-determining protein MreC [Melioribacteraceae bacterium]MCF8420124.1 rod shape-determining protein MreC [Melioribacteraceae bacterium]